MTVPAFIRRLYATPNAACVMGCTLLALSAYFVVMHAKSLQNVRQVAIPTAQRLPTMERRLEVLEQQVNVAQVQAELRSGAHMEVIRTHVLPAEADLSQVLGIFDTARDAFQSQRLLRRMSAVQVGDARPFTLSGSAVPLTATPLSFTVDVTDAGAEALLALLDAAGFLTVGDALTPAEIQQLLLMTEHENAAAIPSLEHFLAVPLLQYARAPKEVEKQLARAFASETFEQDFRQAIRGSRLPVLEQVLGGDIGRSLERLKLWPMRFLTIDSVVSEDTGDGWQRLTLQLTAYARTEQTLN